MRLGPHWIMIQLSSQELMLLSSLYLQIFRPLQHTVTADYAENTLSLSVPAHRLRVKRQGHYSQMALRCTCSPLALRYVLC